MRTLRRKSTSQKIKGEKGFIEESQKTKKKENGHTFTFTPSQHTQRPNPSYSLIIFI